jgi:hypothetical protein
MAIGATLSTGGRGAHGDLTGVGGPGGFATRVGFSLAPFKTNPALPPNPLGLTVGEAAACVGAGDIGFVASRSFASWTAGDGDRLGAGATTGVSSTTGTVSFVPSFQLN